MQTINVDFLKNTCALKLSISAWGNRRQGDMNKVETLADKQRLKLTKQLIDCEEYDAIRTELSDIRKWVSFRTAPLLGFKGVQLAKVETTTIIEAELPKRLETINELVEKLIAVYPDKVVDSEKKLGTLFNQRDYPTVQQLRSMFKVDWNWIAFSVPDNIPQQLREVEAKKLTSKFQDAQEEILLALREGFKEMVSHAVDRLKTEPGGKPKIFRDTLIGNMKEFIETFNARNLVNDNELAELVLKAKNITDGLEPDALRKDESIRERTVKAFEEVKEQITAMISERPSRKFNLDE